MRPSTTLSQGVSGVPVTVSVILHLAVAGALLSAGNLVTVPILPPMAEPSFTVVPVEIKASPAPRHARAIERSSEVAGHSPAPAETPPVSIVFKLT